MTLRPTYHVAVGAEDLTDLIDPDSPMRSMSERGEMSCTFTIPLASENEVASNAIVRDAAVLVSCDGAEPWVYHVVNVSQPQPDEPAVEVECAGSWDWLHHRQDYCKGFVETRMEAFQPYPPTSLGLLAVSTASTSIEADNEAGLLFNLPKASAATTGTGIALYVWPLNGMDPAATIDRVTALTGAGGGSTCQADVFPATASPFSGLSTSIATQASTAYGPTAWDTGDVSASGYKAFVFRYAVEVDTAGESVDNWYQARNVRVYIGRQTAPTIDQAVGEIWTDVTGAAPVLATIGSALTQCMIDPFTTPADAIQQILAKATVPPLCGVKHGVFSCGPRPTAPTDNARLWVVSDQITPGLQWDVAPDTAQSFDCVCLSYTQIIASPTTTPSGLPAKVYYPATPTSLTARVAMIDTGTELTDAEAAVAAQQAYYYYHNFVQGSVTIPFICQNGNGQESPCDHIEAWDWVYNAGKARAAEAGPFLISEVRHQGGVAALTIGASEGYSYESPYRLPTAAKYVGTLPAPAAKKKRRREPWSRWWKRTHKGKPVPAKHPKWHYVK